MIVNVIFGEFYDVKTNYRSCKELCEEHTAFVLLRPLTMLDHPFSTTCKRCLESAVETRICHRGSQFRKTKKFAVIRGFYFL